jgi:enoyl-CoA hydratase
MADDKILHEKKGDATHITINRADCGGLVSNPMAREMAAMIDEASNTSKYIVFRSAGADFCLGRDSEGRDMSKPKDAWSARERNETVFNFYGSFRRCKIPVVCVAQGRSLGFGCAIVSSCDITIAGESSRFALPEMGHHIMPTMAMSSLIDRVNRKGVLYMTYSTEEIDAQHALAFGVVSRVVPDDQLEAKLAEVCAKLDGAPLAAVLSVKEYATNALTMSIEQATDFARNMHAAVNSSAAMDRY